MDRRTTPRRLEGTRRHGADMFTPPAQTSLSRELRQVLNDRNLLTAKSRKKVCHMLSASSDSSLHMTPNTAEHDKRLQFRRQAVAEILTSERSYIAQLDVLMQFFIRPLKEKQLISKDNFLALFGQVEMIYSLNQELLQELEANLDNVAKAFKRMAPFFKLYSVYAFDYNRAQLILQELTDKSGAFKKFLDVTESRPEVQRKLISLLIAPIQRVPRYRLLLQQVVLYSSPSDPDFKMLQDSIKEVECTVSHLNGVIQDQENTQSLLDLQNSLVNRSPNIVKPSRKVIREGLLQKMSSSGAKLRRYCVLMSDIFMYCKCLKERSVRQLLVGSLQCCCIFPLKKCRITEMFPGTFKLTCQGDGVILCAGSADEGRAWLAAIKDTIDVHVQCRKTIRKGSSKRTPMRRKDVKNFENEAANAQTRRKYDYESVFKCSADSDESDDTNTSSKCFSVNPRHLFKRKHSPPNAKANTPAATRSFSAPLSPTAAPITPPIKHWFRPDASSASTMMMTSTPEQHANTTPPFDPTYGFAAYAQSQPGDYYQDILYPLRSSTSNPSSPTTDAAGKDAAEPVRKKKRVKFNTVVSAVSPPTARPFNLGPNRGVPKVTCSSATPSLKTRIVDFFASLF